MMSFKEIINSHNWMFSYVDVRAENHTV